MKETPELMKEVMKRLRFFEHYGLPKTKEGMEGYAGSVCRMIFDQPHKLSPEHPDGWTALESLDATIAQTLDTCVGPLPGPAELRIVYRTLGFSSCEQTPEAVERERWLYHNSGATDEDFYYWKTSGKEFIPPKKRKRIPPEELRN